MAWTTDDLVAAVKRRAQIPDAAGDLTDDDIIALANEELHTQVVPMVLTAREHFFVKDYTLSVGQGINDYRLPPAVLSGTLIQVILVDASGMNLGEVAQVPLERADYWTLGTAGIQPGHAEYALIGDRIRLALPNANGYSILVRYTRRLGDLIAVSSCAKVNGYILNTPSATRTQFNCASVPADFNQNDQYCLVQEVPNFDEWVSNIFLQNIVTGALGTFSVDEDSIPAEYYTLLASQGFDGTQIQTGYWCPNGTTCIVPVPDVFHPVLIRATAAQVLRSLGDWQGAAVEQEALEALKGRIVATITPRTRSRGKTIIVGNHPLRTTAGRRAWRS